MTDFGEVLESQRQAEAFIAETGGLPEITRAAQDLRDALDQTRGEIAEATFASRFPNPPGDYFNATRARTNFSPRTSQLVAIEGEAGAKRSELEHGLEAIELDLFSLINRLVELRCNLIVSQTEM